MTLSRTRLSVSMAVFVFFTSTLMQVNGGVDSVGSATSSQNDIRYQLGKDKFESFERESKLPRYGNCWLKAIESLKSGCRELSEDTQYMLALRFTNCFLGKTGKPTYECDDLADISLCTAKMSAEAYQVLTEFFTHTHNMCFFLQSQAWQDKTETLVTHLVKTSDMVVVQMENASELQGKILKGQIDTIQNQELLGQHLFTQSEKLGQSIEASKNSVDSIMKEFRNIASEQSTLMAEVYNRIMSLHSLLVGEFTGIYSVVLHVCTFIIVYFVTSTPRSSGARFWLNLVIALNIAVERAIIKWNLSDHEAAEQTEHSEEESTRIYSSIVICRKAFLVIGIVIYACIVCRFKDYNRINNQLLVNLETKISKINDENVQLKTMLESVFQGKRNDDDETDSENKTTVLPADLHDQQSLSLPRWPPVRSSTPLDISRISTGYDTWSCEEETTDSSSCDEKTDCTYIPKDDQINNSGSTSRDSSRHSVFRESTPSLLEELKALRESTPFKEIAGFITGNSSFNTTPSKQRDEKHETSSSSAKTKRSTSVPVNCPYNLRSRIRNQPLVENPANDVESPDSFCRKVKHLAKVSARNRAKVLATVKRLQHTEASASVFKGSSPKFGNREN